VPAVRRWAPFAARELSLASHGAVWVVVQATRLHALPAGGPPAPWETCYTSVKRALSPWHAAEFRAAVDRRRGCRTARWKFPRGC